MTELESKLERLLDGVPYEIVMKEGNGPLLPHVKVRLVGEDGNAYAIMGRVTRAMKDHKVDQAIIDAYITEATSSDYDHLLYTTLQYVDMAPPMVCGGCGELDGDCTCYFDEEEFEEEECCGQIRCTCE